MRGGESSEVKGTAEEYVKKVEAVDPTDLAEETVVDSDRDRRQVI